MKHRVQVTLDESTFRYLRSLVDSEEAASLSHAVRRIVKEYRRLRKFGARREAWMGNIALITLTRPESVRDLVSRERQERLLQDAIEALIRNGSLPGAWRLEHVRVLD